MKSNSLQVTPPRSPPSQSTKRMSPSEQFPYFRPPSSSSPKQSPKKLSPEIEYVIPIDETQVLAIQGSPQGRVSSRRGAYAEPRVYSEGHLRNIYATRERLYQVIQYLQGKSIYFFNIQDLEAIYRDLHAGLLLREFISKESYEWLIKVDSEIKKLLNDSYVKRALNILERLKSSNLDSLSTAELTQLLNELKPVLGLESIIEPIQFGKIERLYSKIEKILDTRYKTDFLNYINIFLKNGLESYKPEALLEAYHILEPVLRNERLFTQSEFNQILQFRKDIQRTINMSHILQIMNLVKKYEGKDLGKYENNELLNSYTVLHPETSKRELYTPEEFNRIETIKRELLKIVKKKYAVDFLLEHYGNTNAIQKAPTNILLNRYSTMNNALNDMDYYTEELYNQLNDLRQLIRSLLIERGVNV